MIQKTVSRLAAWTLGLAGVLALTTSSARAEFFEFNTSTVLSGASGGSVSGNTFTSTLGNTVQLIPLSSTAGTPHLNGTGTGSDIVTTNINADSTQTTAVENIGFDFTTTLNLQDFNAVLDPGLPPVPPGTPRGTGSILISGRLQGTIGNFTVNLDLMNYATNPSNGIVATPPSGTVYQVTVSPTGGYTAPGLDNLGTLGANVRVAAVPEPASMAMLGLGGLGALAMFRRRMVKASA
jgi:hypothetical protein